MGDGIVSAATERLAQYGLLGILVAVFGFVIWYLWRDAKNERKAYQRQIQEMRDACEKEKVELRKEFHEEREKLQEKIDESQDARIADAKGFQSETVKLTSQVTLAIASANTLMEGQRDATLETRGALREQTEELRNLSEDIRDRFPRR